MYIETKLASTLTTIVNLESTKNKCYQTKKINLIIEKLCLKYEICKKKEFVVQNQISYIVFLFSL